MLGCVAISSYLTSLTVGIAVLCGAAISAFAQSPIPRRVMTLNMCADQLVLDLLPPERITSVTYISHIASDENLAHLAGRVGINYGMAEEVFAQSPDLVIGGDFSAPATQAILKRAGYPLYEMASAEKFEAIREQTLFVGRLLGAETRAQELVAEMEVDLADLARTRPARPISVVAWDGSGIAPGKGTLFNEILNVAGDINLAAEQSDAYMVALDMEELLVTNPDILAYGADLAMPSLRHEPLKHPAIQQRYGDRQIAYPEEQYVCGGPQSSRVARDLRAAMLAVLAEARPR